MDTNADLIITKLNNTFLKVVCSNDAVSIDIDKNFAKDKPSHQHDPRFQAGWWDGKTHFYIRKSGQMLAGLLPELLAFAKKRMLTVRVGKGVIIDKAELSREDFLAECETWNLPFPPRDAQVNAVLASINEKRKIVISPTGSGKTFIMYLLMRYHMARGRRVLLVVPEKYHVLQFRKNVLESFKPDESVKILYKDFNWKHTDPVNAGNVVVTTNKAIYKKEDSWFTQFDAFIGDEVHAFAAPTFMTTVSKCPHIEYRMGCTGSMGDKVHNHMMIHGLFGTEIVVTTVKESVARGELAKPKVFCVKLVYSNHTMSIFGGSVDDHGKGAQRDFKKEVDFILEHEGRNKFIAKLASKLGGNVLTLFRIKDHGKELVRVISDATGGEVNYVDGDVELDKREEIVDRIKKSVNSQSVCSVGTFATGIDIPVLNHVLKAHPMLSEIKNAQGDGRGMRIDKESEKDSFAVYDIYDVLTPKGVRINHTYKHFKARLKNYEKNGYEIVHLDYRIEG